METLFDLTATNFDNLAYGSIFFFRKNKEEYLYGIKAYTQKLDDRSGDSFISLGFKPVHYDSKLVPTYMQKGVVGRKLVVDMSASVRFVFGSGTETMQSTLTENYSINDLIVTTEGTFLVFDQDFDVLTGTGKGFLNISTGEIVYETSGGYILNTWSLIDVNHGVTLLQSHELKRYER